MNFVKWFIDQGLVFKFKILWLEGREIFPTVPSTPPLYRIWKNHGHKLSLSQTGHVIHFWQARSVVSQDGGGNKHCPKNQISIYRITCIDLNPGGFTAFKATGIQLMFSAWFFLIYKLFIIWLIQIKYTEFSVATSKIYLFSKCL